MSENINHNIFIIGAGISGMTCAEKLVENNFKQINLLEASDRIGGRLHSYPSKKASDEKGKSSVNNDYLTLQWYFKITKNKF